MALEKGIKDIALGTVGLNLKIDQQMLPEGALAQADNVQYYYDGSLRRRYGTPGVNSSYDGKSLATALFTTKEGNIGAVFNGSATRNINVGNVGTVPAPLKGATLQPIPGVQIQLPTGVSTTNPYAAITNLSYALWNTGDGDTYYTICWDTLNAFSAINLRQAFFGVWSVNAGAWATPPTGIVASSTVTLQNGFGSVTPNGYIQPMALSGGSICLGVQFSGNTQLVWFRLQTPASGLPASTSWVGLAPVSPLSAGGYPNVRMDSTQEQARIGGVDSGYVFTCGVTDTQNTAAETQSIYRVAAGNSPVHVAGFANANNAGALALAVDQTAGTTNQLLYCEVAAVGTKFWQIITSAGAYVTNGTLTTAAPGLTNSMMASSNGSAWYIAGLSPGASGGVDQLSVWTVSFTQANSSAVAALISPRIGGKGTTFHSKVFFGPNTGSNLTYYAWVNNGPNYSGVSSTPQSTYICYDITRTVSNNGTPAFPVVGAASYLESTSGTSAPMNILGMPNPIQSRYVAQSPFTFLFLTNEAIVQTAAPSGGGTVPQIFTKLVNAISVTFGATSTCEVPTGTLTSGMSPMYLTPNTAATSGFPWYPTFTCTPTGSGTGPAAGTYIYYAVYQYVDDYNQIQWSRAYPQTVTIGTGGAVTINNAGIPGVTGGSYYIFRTTNGGTIPYALGANCTTDNVTDANLTAGGNTTLYTSSGELPNDPCPPATIVAATSQYAFAASAETPGRVFVSKPFRQGHAPEWNAGQFIDVAPVTGPVTAMAAMDDKLLIFKSTAIYAIYGQGFDVTGANASPSFTQAQQIASFGGCTSAQSVIVTDEGCFYQSSRGIELIDRGLNSQYVGLPLDGQVISITGACLNRSIDQVRFLDTGAGCVWVYDVLVKRWSRYLYGWISSTAPALIAADGAANMNAYGALATGGAPQFYRESSTNFETTDTGALQAGLVPTIKTGWVKMQGLQGFARLYRFSLLGTFLRATTVTVQVAYDYNPTVVDTFTFTGSSVEQFRARLSRQKCESVQFTVTWPDISISPTEDFLITGISLEYGLKSGIYKLGNVQTMG